MEMRGEPDPQTESVISQTNQFSADLDDCSLLSGLAAVGVVKGKVQEPGEVSNKVGMCTTMVYLQSIETI
jgi:hypothetical protein